MHIIFDFDGTLVDSALVVYNSFAGYTKKADLTWDELRDLSSKEVLTALKIPRYQLPRLIVKARYDFKKKINELALFEGIKETLIQLKSDDHSLHIVSSNSKKNIIDLLQRHSIANEFESITGAFTLFSKAKVIQKIMHKNNIATADAIYIGDETRDIIAAKEIGILSGAVSWGYNSAKALEPLNPDFLIHAPSELLGCIN